MLLNAHGSEYSLPFCCRLIMPFGKLVKEPRIRPQTTWQTCQNTGQGVVQRPLHRATSTDLVPSLQDFTGTGIKLGSKNTSEELYLLILGHVG